MVSSTTINTDNPRLDCRLKGFENYSPKRVIIDKNLEINLNSYILKSVKKTNTIIFYNSTNISKLKILKKKKIKIIKIKLNNNKNFDLKEILKTLFKIGIKNLLIEGGNKITKNILKKGLFNQFYLFKSPKKLLKNKKYLIFTSNSILNKMYKNKLKYRSKLVKDSITIYKR